MAVAKLGTIFGQRGRGPQHDPRVDGGHRRYPLPYLLFEVGTQLKPADLAAAFCRNPHAQRTARPGEGVDGRMPGAAGEFPFHPHETFDGDGQIGRQSPSRQPGAEVVGDAVEPTTGNDFEAGLPRRCMPAFERPRHKSRLAGDVAVVGTGQHTGFDHGIAVPVIRPHGGGEHPGGRGHAPQRRGIVDRGENDGGRLARQGPQLGSDFFELARVAPGNRPAQRLRRRHAGEVFGGQLAGKTGRPEEGQVVTAFIHEIPVRDPPSFPPRRRGRDNDDRAGSARCRRSPGRCRNGRRDCSSPTPRAFCRV